MDVAKILQDVFTAADTALRADPTSWYTVNDKFLNVVRGINSRIVNYFGTTPVDPAGVIIEDEIKLIPGEYPRAIVPKIVIVKVFDPLTVFNLRDDDTFNPVLEPAYKQFLVELVKNVNVVDSDPDRVSHTKVKVPAWQPADQQLTQYFDAIEIRNLQFLIYNQIS